MTTTDTSPRAVAAMLRDGSACANLYAKRVTGAERDLAERMATESRALADALDASPQPYLSPETLAADWKRMQAEIAQPDTTRNPPRISESSRPESLNAVNSRLRGDRHEAAPQWPEAPQKAPSEPLDAGRGIQGCGHVPPQPSRSAP